jgi:multiple antibiotic resistance protein
VNLDIDLALAVPAFVTLLVIMDPLGNVPVFLALTGTQDRRERRRTARHATAAAAVLVYLFAFFGTQILAALSIGLPALQAGGGIVLFITALEMLRGDILVPERARNVNVAIVPLGVPLMAGPGAISVAMVYMAGRDGTGLTIANQVSVALAIAAALVICWLALHWAGVLERLLRENGIHLVTRVMGMLLVAISVELIASAVQAYVAGASALP